MTLLKQAVLGLSAVAAMLPLWVTAEGNQPAVWDSKTVTEANNFATRLHWIDDDNVMFVAATDYPDGSVPHRRESTDYSLSIWNVQSGAIRTLRKFGRDRLSPCFYDNRVVVWSRTASGESNAYIGDLGSLVKAPEDERFSAVFCRPVVEVPRLPLWTKGREIHWLPRLEGGFLDFGEPKDGGQNAPIRMHSHGSRQEDGIALPLGRRDVQRQIRYFAFQQAYFIESTYWLLPRPQGIPYPVYWLYGDGRVEKILEIPWGPWRSGGSTWTEPTKRGVALVSTNANVRNERDLGHAGLYLVSGTKVTKLLSAWIQATAVSPSGCRLAFDYADHATQKHNVLKAIDLCAAVKR